MAECTCDYSYTCPQCRAISDIANIEDYNLEMHTWVVTCLQEIAAKLKVTLPEAPQKRGSY